MQHRLRIQLRCCEGAILRTLGLIQRRGYSLHSCSMEEAGGDGRRMDVNVSSERSVELLKRQLERLHDVLWVDIEQSALQAADKSTLQSVCRSK